MSPEPRPTRHHEHRLTLDAPREDVWNAITRAEELVRWFPLAAEATPGAGGEIVYRWGELVGRCRILAWEPPAHLRTGWMEAPGHAPKASPAVEPARAALAVDWYLAADGKTTHLRLVHSGFDRGADWDEEYDGTRRGWTFELQALKHYLEHERGKERCAAWIRRPVGCSPREVWERFTRPGPIFREVALDSLAPGDHFRFVRADGEVLAGRVLVHAPPLELAAVLDGGAMLRFGFERCLGPEAHVWIAAWGASPADLARAEASWHAALSRAFPH